VDWERENTTRKLARMNKEESTGETMKEGKVAKKKKDSANKIQNNSYFFFIILII
jgi:hypothetical protein